MTPSLRLLVAAFCVAVVPLLPANAGGIAKKPDDELVRSLGDENSRVRDQATAELRKRGVQAMKALEAGAGSDDPEVRRRSKLLLDRAPWREKSIELDAFMKGKDDVKLPLPAWPAFRKHRGDHTASRELYVNFYLSDFELLQKLDADKELLTHDYATRHSRFPQMMGAGFGMAKAKTAVTAADTTALLLVAYSATLDQNQVTNLFYLLRNRSVVGVLDSTGSQQLLADFRENKLMPTVNKLVDDAAANPFDNTGKFWNALNLARQFQLNGAIEGKLKPALRKALTDGLREPHDLNRVGQAVNYMQSVGGMEKEMEAALGPIVPALVKNFDFNDNRVYQLGSILRFANRKDVVEAVVKPAARKAMLEVVKKPADANQISQLQQIAYKVKQFDVADEIDAILKPAAADVIEAVFAKGGDVNQMRQALSLAQTLELGAGLNAAALKLVEQVRKSPEDLDRISLCLSVVRAANLPNTSDIIDKTLKPAARKALETIKDQPINPQSIGQTLQTLQEFDLKEGVVLAARMVETKTLQPHLRAQAIQWVAKHGDKKNLDALEPLIGDKTNISSGSMNGMTFNTQLGDIALACTIYLSNEKLGDYGFPFFRMNPNFDFAQSVYQAGFENQQGRDAALKKWREARAKAKA